MRLLLIEDDRMIGVSLVRGLQDEGYTVDWVKDGLSACTALRIADHGYVAALLDWNLPNRDGLSVLNELRSRGDALPVLMLTARDSVDDRITGLDGGADDYLVKPFELRELKARLRSLLRRSAARAGTQLAQGGLTLDPRTRRATLHGRCIALSPREYALLYALLERPGTVLSRQQLEERIYGWDQSVDSNAIEVLIHGARKKLGAATIENLRGLGWRIGAP